MHRLPGSGGETYCSLFPVFLQNFRLELPIEKPARSRTSHCGFAVGNREAGCLSPKRYVRGWLLDWVWSTLRWDSLNITGC